MRGLGVVQQGVTGDDDVGAAVDSSKILTVSAGRGEQGMVAAG